MLAKEWSTVVGRVYFGDGKSKTDGLATRPASGKDRTKNQTTMVVDEEVEEVVMDPYTIHAACAQKQRSADGHAQRHMHGQTH